MNTVKPEHPRPDWNRKDWINLNGTWNFTFDEENVGIAENWQDTSKCNFPSKITVPFSWASPLSGIHDNKKGIGWYSRSVSWTPAAKGNRIFLIFGAVDYICDVWINGRKLGHHRGGYGTFEFDASQVWNPDSPNYIVVRVEDYDIPSQLRGKQGYGEIRGIWQTVYLESRPSAYIKYARFNTKTNGFVEVNGEIESGSSQNAKLDFKFNNSEFHHCDIDLAAGANKFSTSFEIKAPQLWSPENPNLYEGVLKLSTVESSDEVNTYFGVREISAVSHGDKDYPWITLNGKPIFLNGVLDQSYNPEGYFTYPSDEEIKNEIWRLKRIGLNFVRIHIKPEEPRKLYWADKLGIMVMEDMPSTFGEPDGKAREAFNLEAAEVIKRDYNHPSIFSWVIFNETWGLFSKNKEGKSEYAPETQAWVRSRYEWAKREDPTRIIEDNSACNNDHVISDINTWHFYINGYENVKDHIQYVADNTYTGSTWNYTGGNRQNGVPLMNSECGAVWGVDGSAGDSDIAWQYRYMINEFRKHDKICGFVFTEFHDVINEFNGYYRIDNTDKDFGYDAFTRDMSLRDLHSPDFLVIDAPPCRTAKTSEEIEVPLSISSFSSQYHKAVVKLEWQFWYDNLGEKTVLQSGSENVFWSKYGLSPLLNIKLKMPQYDALPVLSLTLRTFEGKPITRNFITFDVQSERPQGSYNIDGNWLSIKPASYSNSKWDYSWKALDDNKVNGGNTGFFEYNIALSREELCKSISGMEILFEGGAKAILAKDKEKLKVGPRQDLNYMLGAKSDPEMNLNSYFMTDERKHSSLAEVLVDDEIIEVLYLPDDPADSRGVLSWHYQPQIRRLEEAGSYGYLQKVKIPSRLVKKILDKGSFTLKLRVPSDLCETQGGLAIYGRNAGRYPLDILIRYY